MGVTVRHQSAIQLCCESGVEDRNYQNKKQYEVFHSFFFFFLFRGAASRAPCYCFLWEERMSLLNLLLDKKHSRVASEKPHLLLEFDSRESRKLVRKTLDEPI